MDIKKSIKQKNCGYHFNLYGINKNYEEILFTKDHIIPKSKGGDNKISNYQTMCYNCNYKKGRQAILGAKSTGSRFYKLLRNRHYACEIEKTK